MGGYKSLILMLSLCALLAPRIQVQANVNSAVDKAIEPTIAVTSVDVNKSVFKLSYEIKNNCSQDVWICTSVGENIGNDFEVYMDNDIQAIVVRRRMDVPKSVLYDVCPHGKYIRMRPGEKRIESVLLSLPVRLRFVYMDRPRSILFGTSEKK